MIQTVKILLIHALKKLKLAQDLKLEIIVFHPNPKILNKKSSIMDQSL